ncbi:TPA: hypothetical protein ACRR3T_004836, partial [Enterobacter asburiae]
KKTAGGVCMVLDEERISMKIQAMGRAVMELSLADIPVTQEAIIDKLKQYRKETGNVIGKGANRDAAELVRKGQ